MKFLNFLLCLFSATSAFAGTWDLNDVTYLLPLPQQPSDLNCIEGSSAIPYHWLAKDLADEDGLSLALLPLRASVLTSRMLKLKAALAEKQATLHQSTQAFQQDQNTLPEITVGEYEKTMRSVFDSLKLVAVRIDPCFKDHFEEPCRMQVRAVWQPITFSQKQPSRAEDAAIHTFYDLKSDEFQRLTLSLKKLKYKFKIDTTALPLTIHPGFLKSPGFKREFIELMKRYLVPEKTTRIAFMQLIANEFEWAFLSFDVRDAKLQPIQPVGLTGLIQDFTTTAPISGHVEIVNLPGVNRELESLSSHSTVENDLLKALLNIENPRKHLPGTIDCLSCHVSAALKGTQAKILELEQIPTIAKQLELKLNYNFKNVSDAHHDTGHFRALGYIRDQILISDRVINESATVADSLNRNTR